MNPTLSESDCPADPLSRLQQRVARRADELARQLEEPPVDSILWARAEAEIFSRHLGESPGTGRTPARLGRDPRSA